MKTENDKLEKLVNLMTFLKDNYKRQAFIDTSFSASLIRHHMHDFFIELSDDDVDRVAFLLQPVK